LLENIDGTVPLSLFLLAIAGFFDFLQAGVNARLSKLSQL